jgi:hypothetical protein
MLTVSVSKEDFSAKTLLDKKERQVQLEETYDSMKRNVNQDVMQDIERFPLFSP